MCGCDPSVKGPYCGRGECHPPRSRVGVTYPAWYQHVDGGLYRSRREVLHTETQEKLVVFDHVWPHDGHEGFARPVALFVQRFEEITDGEAKVIMELDRDRARRRIEAAKATRRRAEGTVVVATTDQAFLASLDDRLHEIELLLVRPHGFCPSSLHATEAVGKIEAVRRDLLAQREDK